MKNASQSLIPLTLLSLSLFITGCGGATDKSATPQATTTETANAGAKSSDSPELPVQVPKTEVPRRIKSQEQPVVPGSGQTFVGILRAKLPMQQKATYIDWSPDGKWLLVDGPELWSTETGKPVRKFDPAKYARFHPNGTQIICGEGKTVVIRDLSTGTVVKKIASQIKIDEIACSADGNRLLITEEISEYAVCDVDQGQTRKLNRNALGITWDCGAISPDGKTLAVSGENGKLVLIDADTLAVIATRDAHSGKLAQIAFSHDGKLLATCCNKEKNLSDNVIRIWNAATGVQLNQYTCDESYPQQMQFSPGDTRLLSVGRKLYADDPLGQGLARAMLDTQSAIVECAAFSPDSHHVAAVTIEDQDIYLFDLVQTCQEKTIAFMDYNHPDRLVPLPGNDRLLALDDGHPAAFFDPVSKSKTPFGEDVDYMPAVSPDGKTFVVPDGNQLFWYNLADGKEFRKTEGSFSAAGFHPDGKTVLAGKRSFNSETMTRSFEIQEVDAATGALKREFAGLSDDVTSVTASQDGRWLASGGKEGHVHVINCQAGKVEHQAPAHKGAVSLVRFSPSGEWLVSLGGDEDRVVGLWKIDEQAPRKMTPASTRFTGAVFSPDSKLLVASTKDGQFCVWNLDGVMSSFVIHSGAVGIGSMDPLPAGDGFISICLLERCAKIWKFRDLQRPLTFDNLVRTDVSTRK